ncbi:unnamed protein product [Mytilus coruscus]|uniref:Uncharacterized protein n=1 Tax=Mytilus coruscus TaxID=42192 RepID=A0A6J8BQ81_MYTCO|nr:unnamed protein product [Mytilus coruscus]
MRDQEQEKLRLHTDDINRKEQETSMEHETDGEIHNDNNTQSERKRKLLRKGGMPLFPAGRREWDQEELVTLTTIPAVVSWPPKNWKGMTPEQKYFNWEYASITLELNSRKLQFLKEELLLKYHFLTLPATKTPTGNEENTMAIKSRFYLYKAIAHIIKSDKEDISTLQTLKMLETAVNERDDSTDCV